MNYTVDKLFDKIKFQEEALEIGEYENCVFRQCDFSNTNLSEIKFIDSEFIGSNLSLAVLTKTAFRDIKFNECKMLGLHFENCNEFGLAFTFENCQLNHSSFYKTIIKKTTFNNCQLIEVDFTECELTGSIFENCDLNNAVFNNTTIEKVDFRTAFNYSIDPELNRIKMAKFSIQDIPGLLNKYHIDIES